VPADSEIAVALIYPSLLGTYGDGGNASVLAQRARWRGVPARVLAVDVDEPVPAADLFVLGGGEDTAQTLAVDRLTADGRLHRTSAPIFAVCAGLQICGETFLDGAGADHPGLGLLDARTGRLAGPRAVGELVADGLEPDIGRLTGYENHGGATVLGPAARPLARVVSGVGNGDGADGAVQDNLVATYLHGPALARNPALADHLLARILGELGPLDDGEEGELRRERLAAVLGRRGWRARLRRRGVR
jgi:CobQ-like glutamine amidotransferase family enzyme